MNQINSSLFVRCTWLSHAETSASSRGGADVFLFPVFIIIYVYLFEGNKNIKEKNLSF
jgi:hypothetical protein